jgi:hypothetical protein
LISEIPNKRNAGVPWPKKASQVPKHGKPEKEVTQWQYELVKNTFKA